MGLPMKPRVYVVEGRCIRISILGLSLFSSILEISTRNAWGFEFPPIHLPLNRREYFKTSATLVTTTLGLPHSTVAAEEFVNEPDTSQGFQAYRIIPDASAALSPGLVPLEPTSFLKQAAAMDKKTGGALWLGEHHNAAKDHNLQAKFIRSIYDERKSLSDPTPIAIGLEQVQLQFQPALDDYVAGRISAAEMKRKVEWEKRWFWPFDVYEPIFETARELGIPLIALNVNSEDLAEVERAGLPGLPRDRLQLYIKDPQGFAAFAKPQEYRDYVQYVIAPSYDLHQQMGLLRRTISGQVLEEDMTFRNFFSGRILWDESMASNAYSWVQANPGGLMIGLIGADHVKFKNGVPGRFARMAGGSMSCTSVMLNPTLIDTRPSGSVGNVAGSDSSLNPDGITLQLRYFKEGVDIQSAEARRLPESTGGVMPLADFIVVG